MLRKTQQAQGSRCEADEADFRSPFIRLSPHIIGLFNSLLRDRCKDHECPVVIDPRFLYNIFEGYFH